MKALKFKLSGKTAFFKKPDVNSYYYFTYGNIHKLALLGIIGSCLGLKGYYQQQDDEYPEFYEKLRNIKLAIVPKNKEGYINKKVQIFNNSVGYASKEQGGNLIVKEQWLENPIWDIYILLEDNDILNEIKRRFLNRKFVYIPYLGKNDHIANIDNIEIIDLYENNNFEKVNSLFIKDDFEFVEEDFSLGIIAIEEECSFKYEEKLPIGLESVVNKYILKSMVFTNMKIVKNNINVQIYNHEGINLYFF